MKYKLYYLVDPESREIRYVGVTSKSLEKRLQGHVHKIDRKDRTRAHKDRWIAKLVRRGMKPEINLLQAFKSEEDCFAAEKYWVEYFRNVGCDLTNTTAGGRGCFNPSEETRKKMSAAATGGMPGNTVRVIDQDGNVYNTCREAAEKTGVGFKSISEILCGKRRQAKGYVFARYEGTETQLPTIRDRKDYHNATKVIDQHGNIFDTVNLATSHYGFKSHKSISNVLIGKSKSAGGVTFKYYTEDGTTPPPFIRIPYWTGKKRTHLQTKKQSNEAA